jgi:hypothetical protein
MYGMRMTVVIEALGQYLISIDVPKITISGNSQRAYRKQQGAPNFGFQFCLSPPQHNTRQYCASNIGRDGAGS